MAVVLTTVAPKTLVVMLCNALTPPTTPLNVLAADVVNVKDLGVVSNELTVPPKVMTSKIASIATFAPNKSASLIRMPVLPFVLILEPFIMVVPALSVIKPNNFMLAPRLPLKVVVPAVLIVRSLFKFDVNELIVLANVILPAPVDVNVEEDMVDSSNVTASLYV